MKNNQKILTLVIIILSIISIGSVGFIAYDKFFQDDSVEKKLVDEIDKSNNISTEKESQNNKDNESVSNDDPYSVFVENMKKARSNIDVADSQGNKYNFNSTYVKTDSSTIDYIVAINSNGELTITYFDWESFSDIGTYKIADNVLFFNLIDAGYYGRSQLFFVREDGTVSATRIDYNIFKTEGEKFDVINNVSDCKKIVNIIRGSSAGGMSAIFIDVYGNIYQSPGDLYPGRA